MLKYQLLSSSLSLFIFIEGAELAVFDIVIDHFAQT